MVKRLGAAMFLTLSMSVAAAAAGQVIPAPGAIDQPGVSPTSSAPLPPTVDLPVVSLLDVSALFFAAIVLAAFFNRGWNRLGAAPARRSAIPPVMALALFAGFMICGPIAVSLGAKLARIELGPDIEINELSLVDQARLTLFAYLGQGMALAAFILLQVRVFKKQQGRDARRSAARSVAFGVGALLLAWPVVATAGALAGWLWWLVRGEPADLIAHETLRLFLQTPIDGWYIFHAMLIVFVAPVMEEVMYRGLIQESLVWIDVPRWPAILLTSALFAIMHGGIASAHALPALFMLSLALGWAYEKTGRLAAPIVMHMLFNAGNLTLALAMGETAPT